MVRERFYRQGCSLNYHLKEIVLLDLKQPDKKQAMLSDFITPSWPYPQLEGLFAFTSNERQNPPRSSLLNIDPHRRSFRPPDLHMIIRLQNLVILDEMSASFIAC